MWRWSLSTVRAVGGHDSSSRLSYFLDSSSLRPATARFSRTHINAAVPAIGSAKELENSLVFYPTGPRDTLHSSAANPSSHPVRCTNARAGDTAIDALRRCLSPDNATSHNPLVYSSTTIRSLYYSAESRGQLDMLDSKMLTLLIGLFGSLSVDIQPFPIYSVPLASRVLAVSTWRTHWPFVLKVGRYKSERGMPLHDSDRFWLMRAELAVVRASSSKPLSDDAYSAILRARTHYHTIRRHSCHPEVHAHYLEALLAIQDSRLLDPASRDLSFLLRTHNMCHTRLQRLLFRLVTQQGGYLSTRSQEVILAALWGRICRGTDETIDFVPHGDGSDISVDNCNSDATRIARSVSTILFSFPAQPSKDKLTIMPAILFSVFCPMHALSLRWNSLVLLSVFNFSETTHLDGTHWTSNHMIPQVPLCWQVIFSLGTIERILREPTSASEMRVRGEILETTHSLYQQWVSIIKSSFISPDLAYAVATTFLKMASVLADATLFYGCQDLVENNSEGPQTAAPKHFAVQYIAAVVRVQGLLPDVVVKALAAFSLEPKEQQQILTSAVEAIASLDASLAYMLYTFAQAKGMEPDVGAARTLIMCLAERGMLHQAVILLKDSQFSLETRGVLLSVIARSLRENGRTRHPQSLFVAITDELLALYQSNGPPEHFRGHLEQLFVILAQHGRGTQLFPAVLSILRGLPFLFQRSFFDRYCRALVRHGQITTVSKLLDAIAIAHPETARSLRIFVDRITVRSKTSWLFKRTSLCAPSSLKLSSRLCRSPGVELPLEHSLRELLKIGSILVAKHTFTRVAASIPCNRRTALGNILIHRVALHPTSRNGRRVRKVLALLENLVKDHGFQPDRVTANILVKVMISWRSTFNSPRLRGLFDQVIRAGYPAADYSPLHLPFGTRQSESLGPSSFSKLPSFVSFEKHSKPLFRMFIKAFYSCNDVEAARKVIGILKVEECKNALAKEARQRARSKGRIKTVQKKVDTAVP